MQQHETETTFRRTPVAVHAIKTSRLGNASSPVASSQKRLTSSQALIGISETHRKLTFSPESPKANRIRRAAAQDKFVGLGGFQSGFASTPVKTKGKGKARETIPSTDDLFVPPAIPFSSPPSSPAQAPPHSQPVTAFGDVLMDNTMPFPSANMDRPPGLSSQPAWQLDPNAETREDAKAEDPPSDDIIEVVTPNWKDEVRKTLPDTGICD